MSKESLTTNHWRETVRDIFDELHFGEQNVFNGSKLAGRLVNLIEKRHPVYFNGGHEACKKKKQ